MWDEGAMETFFEFASRVGLREASRQLGLKKSTVHRCFHVQTKVNDRVLEACTRTLGDRFDHDRTVVEWARRRAATSQPDAA